MDREEFVAGLGFDLDSFQIEAMVALDRGQSVLVAAPTGSGKTVVAEYAVAKALAEGGKAFYTTPLKALSNQKFGDLVRRYGPEKVGLLTGDNVINGDAPVVVMTTEVLRNMIYAGSATLDGLRYVVLDEVHFLQNEYRGPVWEEVIIHLPLEVDLVCLSATVSNAEELRDWIHTARGSTAAIIEERRPIELNHLFLVGERGSEEAHLLPTLVDGQPNPVVVAMDGKVDRTSSWRDPHRRRPALHTPRRAEVIERLDREDMLPAIYFIFSRAACEEAVQQCIHWGLRLTTPEDREAIREIVENKVEHLSDDDLRMLDYGSFLHGMEQGFAAHHAGMVPPFKEAVEACFARALVRVVFATETLALGINMPARSVVIERVQKFDGESKKTLTSGEYTQIAGRAGRRGIDEVGYSIVLWSPVVPFTDIAGLVSKRSSALTSAFRPTYNMAANLVRRYSPDQAHHLLNLSFAQFRADSEIVEKERSLEKARQRAAEAQAAALCELGDVAEYLSLHRDAKKAAEMHPSVKRDIERALTEVKPGHVLIVARQPQGGKVLVISTGDRGGGRRIHGVNVDTGEVVLSSKDFTAPPRPVAYVLLPKPYQPKGKRFKVEAARSLREVRVQGDGWSGSPAARDRARRATELHRSAADHPVTACPEFSKHKAAAKEAIRLAARASELERDIRSRTESLARDFDRVLRVLDAWGYVDGWSLTPAGEHLTHIFHECDLLIAESLRKGLFDDLDPAGMAAVASCFTYEHRAPTPSPEPHAAPRVVRDRIADIRHLGTLLNFLEEREDLRSITRQPDAGFAAIAYRWASGHDLTKVLLDEDLTGGDFVRNVKQLVDLLRQLGSIAADPATARAAERAASSVFRGVVAASAVVASAQGIPVASSER
ncbi:MAG TPA: DEAD/DEAH box helicase [Acidimicrobiales bacterium]|nr:DEAD/DEAH box helicase [Acidimicrobiales bacterium]